VTAQRYDPSLWWHAATTRQLLYRVAWLHEGIDLLSFASVGEKINLKTIEQVKSTQFEPWSMRMHLVQISQGRHCEYLRVGGKVANSTINLQKSHFLLAI